MREVADCVNNYFRMDFLQRISVGAGRDDSVLEMRLDQVPALRLERLFHPTRAGGKSDSVMIDMIRFERAREVDTVRTRDEGAVQLAESRFQSGDGQQRTRSGSQ